MSALYFITGNSKGITYAKLCLLTLYCEKIVTRDKVPNIFLCLSDIRKA